MATRSVNTRGIGLELQRLRRARKLSCREVGAAIGLSASTISRIETGRRQPTADEVVAVLAALGVTGVTREHLVDLAHRQAETDSLAGTLSSEQSRTYRNFEVRAAKVTEFAPVLVPDLAQTPEYAYAVLSAVRPDAAEDDVEDQVGERMSRHAILTRRQPPALHWIVTESGLRQPIGGAKRMSEQVRRLAELAGRSNITVSVVPSGVAVHAGLLGQFVVLDFAAEPTVVHVADLTTGLFLDDPDKVAAYRLAARRLTEVALDAEESARLLDSIARDLDSDTCR
ncbi:MAG TPA: helix-turn-helix transcriptional regulator [Pseudonocardiaceae bacterium]|jgi:transcriptional regulator with XRE-family HTH domain|nr:helix-turn-helix transcriptional regulator [Pseudonocardiaceae bacterium]